MTITDFIEDARDELKDTERHLSDHRNHMEALQQSIEKDLSKIATITDTIAKLESLQDAVELEPMTPVIADEFDSTVLTTEHPF